MILLGYSLQSNEKTAEGGKVPYRNEQFEFINKTVLSFMSDKRPVVSVACKKKELIGNLKNACSDWFEQVKTPEVKVYGVTKISHRNRKIVIVKATAVNNIYEDWFESR